MSARTLPAGFDELEPWVADWAKPLRNDRYAVRLSKSIDDLGAFYDAIAARAEDAMVYLDTLDVNDLPADAANLMYLLQSMIMAAGPVNAYHQPSIPDSGAAFFHQVIDPTV